MTLLRALAGPLWRWPVLLALLSLSGLVAGLLADGLWDSMSWILLALPVAVSGWFGWRRP